MMEPPQLIFIILGILLIAASPILLLLFYKGIKNKETHFPLMSGESIFKYRKWKKDEQPFFYTIGIVKLLVSTIVGLILGIIFLFVGLTFF
ncbi:MAG: hypothetical protein KAS76_03670 [Thermoplasmatales archaeon]|nr:hypothetical protein [Thermoplasmatales archaeon]